MNLFFKIFLWFLAAIALMIGTMLFLNWTVQTEPVVSRWRLSVRSQTNIYAETAVQVFKSEGESGLNELLARIRKHESIGEVDLIGDKGHNYLSEGVNAANYTDFVARAMASDSVEIENQPETALSARKLTLSDGSQYVLIVRWERPRMIPFFGESPLRYARYGALLFAALLLCWALARYLSSPIGKLRRATQRLADGDLSARVAGEVGNRLDEISALAKDFDVMAERIESLIDSQKRLSRDISHELRSPLSRLNVALEIAKKKATPDSAPQLERIENESHRLNEMISRLLTLSKLETGARDFERHELNLRSLVEQVVSDAEFEAGAKGRSVKLVSADECRVVGSEGLIQSAVENVLRNAVKYTREGTEVKVWVERQNGNANVKIMDHGGGVPDDELANLFRPFYRVGEARDRGSGGTGLGLAIAEQAIRAHEGTISAKNEADGLIVEISLKCKA